MKKRTLSIWVMTLGLLISSSVWASAVKLFKDPTVLHDGETFKLCTEEGPSKTSANGFCKAKAYDRAKRVIEGGAHNASYCAILDESGAVSDFRSPSAYIGTDGETYYLYINAIVCARE